MISSRDFAVFQNTFECQDGSKIFMWHSTEIEEIPKEKGHVRGSIEICGIHIQPINEKRCSFRKIGILDPKGMIPSSVVNMLTGIQHSVVKKKKRRHFENKIILEKLMNNVIYV